MPVIINVTGEPAGGFTMSAPQTKDQTAVASGPRDKVDRVNEAVGTVNVTGRTETVEQGDEKVTVKMGNRTVEISMGNETLNIKMGNQSTKLDLGASTTEAMQSIELKVGQSSIKVDQTGVTIKGMMISIEGQVQTQLKRW